MKKMLFFVIGVVGILFYLFFVNSQKQKPININELEKVKVENSSWDGSVYQVKNYIKATVADRKSLEFIEWSPVQKDYDSYRVRCKYRVKNKFGGYEIKNKVFTLDLEGNVIK